LLVYYVYIGMNKFHVTIQFRIDDEFMTLVPPHRTYVDHLINKEIIEHYAVSMESQQVWITLKADSKKEIEKILEESPLHKYFTYTIDELYVLDGQNYRLPTIQFN
jgi:hypothetical protein